MLQYLMPAVMLAMFALCGCKCVCLDVKTQHDVSRLYGTYSVEITECPRRVSKADVMVKLKEKMGAHLADSSDAWNVGNGQVVDLKIKITDTEDEHKLSVLSAILCVPSCWTLLAIPLYGTVDHNVVSEIECSATTHNVATEIEETIVRSSLPWSYMPICWHDIGYATLDEGEPWCDREDTYNWFVDKVAESIVATLTKEFYNKATGGVENE